MYAICRVGKIKSQSQLSQAQSHNLRQRETFNADPLKTSNNEILYGSPFVRDEELKLKQKLELEQKRKEELAKRPKGESSLDLDEQRKNKMKPEPEPQQQIEYSRPRPRF